MVQASKSTATKWTTAGRGEGFTAGLGFAGTDGHVGDEGHGDELQAGEGLRRPSRG